MATEAVFQFNQAMQTSIITVNGFLLGSSYLAVALAPIIAPGGGNFGQLAVFLAAVAFGFFFGATIMAVAAKCEYALFATMQPRFSVCKPWAVNTAVLALLCMFLGAVCLLVSVILFAQLKLGSQAGGLSIAATAWLAVVGSISIAIVGAELLRVKEWWLV